MSASKTSARRGSWSILSAATLWGTTGVVTRTIYDLSATNALSVAFFRLAIGALVLLLLCWRLLGPRVWRIQRRDALLLGFLGITQAIFQFSYLAAIPYCGVTIATLIALCVAPVLVVIFAALFQHEPLTLKRLFALLCALAGTALLLGAPSAQRTFPNVLLGAWLSLVCAIGYAGVVLIGRAVSSRCHPLQVNAASIGTGALLLLTASWIVPLTLNYPLRSWLLLFYLGCVPTAFAYALFQAGMRSTSATVTSILTLCEPLTAALLAWLLFGERLGPFGILGALLLLSTIFLLARAESAPTPV